MFLKKGSLSKEGKREKKKETRIFSEDKNVNIAMSSLSIYFSNVFLFGGKQKKNVGKPFRLKKKTK